MLKPVAQFPDPVRGGDNILVCEVMNVDMTPHASNTRAALQSQLKILVKLSLGLVWNKSIHFMNSLMTHLNMANL